MADARAPRADDPGRDGIRAGRVCGIAGQVLNAGTNVATSYVASLLLVPEDFGRFVIAFGCVTLVLGAGRGLLGATMLVHLPTLAPDDRAVLVRSAMGFAVAVGLLVSALLAVIGFWAPVLWWFAPWVVVALLQDVGRYVHLATGRPGRALTLDAVWAALQATAVAIGVLVSNTITIGLLGTAWGLGALGGLLTFAITSRPGFERPGRWTRATRDVAGWFTVVAVFGQVELYLVLLLAGVLLDPSDVGGLRAMQLLSLQPALVLLGSMLTVLQPAVVRAATEVGGLARVWPRVTLAVSPVVAGAALVMVLREPLVGALFPAYAGYADLVVPVALQSAILAFGVAPLAVLNGLRLGAVAFAAQATRLVAAGAAVVSGSALAGLSGAAWALTAVAVVTWLQARTLARRAVDRHENAGSPGRRGVAVVAAEGVR